VTFSLDVGVIAALAICRPARKSPSLLFPWLKIIGQTIAGAIAFLVFIAGAFLLAFDKPMETLARLRGELISVEPFVTDLGEDTSQKERTFSVQLLNGTDQPVRVVGGTARCSCVVIDDLPVTVPANGRERIQVRGRFTGTPGRFQHTFLLLTDCKEQPAVVGRFAGRVLDEFE
jgi:hypothetical protein